MNGSQMNPTDTEQTVSLREIAAILKRRKALIAITFLLVIAAVTAVTFLMPKQYQTRMKVLVKNERADVVVRRTPSSAGDPLVALLSSQFRTDL
jgi:uncharacterized protein involved in exopolysaccharide biosynthesis